MALIIVVDDALTDRTLVTGILGSAIEGEILTAENAESALSQMEARRPDLVLTDIQMPGMNGLELLQEIKKEYPMVPVVLMTAVGSEDIAAQAMKAGATSYVPKRRLAGELSRTVIRILAAREDREIPLQLMHRLDTADLKFTLRNDPDQVTSAVALLQTMLRCLPLSDECERVRIGLALEAALSNALFHGNMDTGQEKNRPSETRREELFRERWNQKPWCDRRIRLSAEISRQQARFVVSDDGDGFDTSKVDSGVMTLDTEGGRGLPLMYTIMDSVEFNGKGNEVTLIRRRFEHE